MNASRDLFVGNVFLSTRKLFDNIVEIEISSTMFFFLYILFVKIAFVCLSLFNARVVNNRSHSVEIKNNRLRRPLYVIVYVNCDVYVLYIIIDSLIVNQKNMEHNKLIFILIFVKLFIMSGI